MHLIDLLLAVPVLFVYGLLMRSQLEQVQQYIQVWTGGYFYIMFFPLFQSLVSPSVDMSG